MMTTQDYVAGLRKLADWYEGHLDAPRPYAHETLAFNVANREAIQEVLRAFGGKWTKEASSGLMYFYSTFGPFRLKMYTGQENVCTMRQVGTKVVPAIPAQPEREVPIYEWDCGSILTDTE